MTVEVSAMAEALHGLETARRAGWRAAYQSREQVDDLAADLRIAAHLQAEAEKDVALYRSMNAYYFGLAVAQAKALKSVGVDHLLNAGVLEIADEFRKALIENKQNGIEGHPDFKEPLDIYDRMSAIDLIHAAS